MKKYPAFFGLLLWVVAGLVWSSLIHAQAPAMMSYQAVVRNSVGDLVTNSPVGVRITIIQGSATGNAVFTEVYTPNRMTNAQGLLSLEIGTGSPQVGTFAGINWAAGPFFLQTEVDLSGGTNYQVLGTQQLLTVPYSFYSNSSGGLSYPGGTASLASTGNGILYICNGIIQTTPCLPSVLTNAASAITSTGATTGGNVTSDGGASVTARGVAFGTAQNPTTANSTTSNGTGTGVFTSTLTGLTAS
ncbi:MAG: collagen-like protein, partial [Bacteroidota bacterium]